MPKKKNSSKAEYWVLLRLKTKQKNYSTCKIFSPTY